MLLYFKLLNEKYPMAYLEWLRLGDVDFEYITKPNRESVIRIHSPNVGLNILPVDSMFHYFDNYGIYVDTAICDQRLHNAEEAVFMCKIIVKGWAAQILDSNGFGVQDYIQSQMDGTTQYFPSRLKALEAGILKAFEFRENQLNDQINERAD